MSNPDVGESSHVIEGERLSENIKWIIDKTDVNLYTASSVFSPEISAIAAQLLEALVDVNGAQFQYHFYHRKDIENVAEGVATSFKGTFDKSTDCQATTFSDSLCEVLIKDLA